MCVCGHYNVPMLTSNPVLKLLDSQGYLWIPYDLLEVVKLIEVTFKLFFQENILCHPFVLLSFLLYYCHSFWIIVISSKLLSILPYITIPSKLLPFQIFCIQNSSGTLPYPKGEKVGRQSPVVLNSTVYYYCVKYEFLWNRH